MDSAILKDSEKEYLAYQIYNIGLEHKYKKGLYEKNIWLCPEIEIEKYIGEKEDIYVHPVKRYVRKDGIEIPTHFSLYPNYSDKIILREESEEHKMAKDLMSSILELDFKFEYDGDLYDVKSLPINHDKIIKREATKNIKTTGERKRTDVLIPLDHTNYWGNGIAIEIRISETEEKQEEKENFWFQRGYSIIWMNKEDFVSDDGTYGIKNKIIPIIPCSIGYKRILDNHIEKMRSYLNDGWKTLHEEQIRIKFTIDEIKDEYKKFILKIEEKSIINELNKSLDKRESELISRESKLKDMIDSIDSDSFKDNIKVIAEDEINSFKENFRGLLSDVNVALSNSKKTCRTCMYGSKNDRSWIEDDTFVCWYGTIWGKGNAYGHNKRPTVHESLDGCNNHENR